MTAMHQPTDETQAHVFAALMEPTTWVGLAAVPVAAVERIETHGAVVFLAGDVVLKIKRAVKLPYFDFSTLDRRRSFSERELALNQPGAPDIYRALVPIIRRHDGRYAIGGGDGDVVEWAILMTRFAQDDLMENVAERRGVSPDLAKLLADMAARSHALAPVVAGVDMADRVHGVADVVGRSLGEAGFDAAGFLHDVRSALDEGRPLLARRAAAGFVRRCHGDLHLGNIVLWQNRPVPFDAIEFDEDLATVDTLYDLAFLLMDLDRHRCRSAANAVLARYLWRTRDPMDLEGLALLPLFLALRAGVRAMVRIDRARQLDGAQRSAACDRAAGTFALARSYLAPPPPRLVAVGGFSGTGKSTLAARLAPEFGAAPGALHLRSDLERKALADVEDAVRLPPEAYTPAASAEVYETLFARARLALAAGCSVIVDAVFALPDERARIAAVASACRVPFAGLWLDAAPDVLKTRVAARRGDASDATVAVVERQLDQEPGAITWHRIDAGHGAEATFARAFGVLNLSPRSGP